MCVCVCVMQRKSLTKGIGVIDNFIYPGVKSTFLAAALVNVLLLFSGKQLHLQAGMCAHSWQQSNKVWLRGLFSGEECCSVTWLLKCGWFIGMRRHFGKYTFLFVVVFLADSLMELMPIWKCAQGDTTSFCQVNGDFRKSRLPAKEHSGIPIKCWIVLF